MYNRTTPQHTMKKHTMHRPVLMLLAMSFGPGLAWSQDAAKSGSTPERTSTTTDETIVLSPFTVDTTKDKGYRATNTTSGTRLNIPIKNLPANLEVVTSEFIRDTGATDLRQALRYSAGVVLESQSDALREADSNPQTAGANDPRGNTKTPGDSTTKIRGFVIDQVLQDGFRRVRTADSINIERVEILRGPSALLYGVGNFGGVINYITKTPLQVEQTHLGATVGSNGLYRSEFDYTTPLGGGQFAWKPAFRITGAYQENGDYTEYYKRKAYTIDPVFTFKPFSKTTVLVGAEFGHEDQQGVGFQNLRSNLNTGAAHTASWLTDVSNGLIDNRTFRWSGPDTYLRGPYHNLVLDLQQQVGENLFAKLGVTRSRSTFDSRQISDTGTKTEPFSRSDSRAYNPNSTVSIGNTSYNLANAIASANSAADGKFQGLTVNDIYNLRTAGSFRGDRLYGFVVQDLYQNQILPGPPSTSNTAAIYYRWVDDNKVEDRDQIRGDIDYKLDLGSFGTHNFVAGVQYMHLKSGEDQFSTPYSYNGHQVDDIARYSYHNPGDYGVFRYGTQGDGTPDPTQKLLYHTDVATWDLGYYAIWQAQYWKDHITTILGARRDRNDATNVKNYVYETTHKADNNSRSIFSPKAPTATSPQAGLSIALTKQISVFGLYSTAVVPNYTDQDGNGQVFAPTKAKNYEAGVKIDLFDGKVSGTVSAFRTIRKNTPRYLWWAPAPYKSVQNGFNASAPLTTVWRYASPESLWYAIHNTTNGLAVAKQIYSSAWWPALDTLAAAPSMGTIYTQGAGSQGSTDINNWWSYNRDANGHMGLSRDAEAYTDNSTYTGKYVFPLVNYSDPTIGSFINSAKYLSGQWGGNFYGTYGQNYQYANGSVGLYNAPDGSGASVPIDDQATGWDTNIVISLTDDLQMTLNYSHINRKVTSETYKFVNAPFYPYGWWYQQDNNYGTLDYLKTPAQVYGNVADTTTYHAQIPDYGQSEDDSPANTASIWVRWSLDKVLPIKGITVGAGGYWEDRRLWYTGFTGGGGNVERLFDANNKPTLVQLWTKTRTTVNAMVEYRTKLANKYNSRFALNVDNLLDDQSRYGQIYAPGASYKFSVGLDF